MGAQTFSLILLPTLQCNAACDCCFEDKTDDRLSLARLEILIDKVLDHLVAKSIRTLTIHWQGGEVMTLAPAWLAEAHRLIGTAAADRGVVVTHGLQSNLIGYGPRWNTVIREMFGNQVSTSLDYPNLYRHRYGKDAGDYDRILTENIPQAHAAGIEVQAIAVPNAATLAIGAERFYSHVVDHLGIRSFQVNTPFPGGSLACDYLALCHGGCAVRAFSVHGTLFEKDPHCELYRSLFGHMAAAAARLACTPELSPDSSATLLSESSRR